MSDGAIRTPDELRRWLNAIDDVDQSTEYAAVAEVPYAIDVDDLFTIYWAVRSRSAVSVLEFGSGWSTLVLALALHENSMLMLDQYTARHPNPFRLQTVDASSEWLSVTLGRIPDYLKCYVTPVTSTPRLCEFRGHMASLYDDLPFFVPDLIYVDGPDQEQVEGSLRGFVLTEMHSLPMNADLLALEMQLWPGTEILFDGRRANAQFLSREFKRNWQTYHDPYGDRTWMRLDESPLGPVSELHIQQRLSFSRALLAKSTPRES